MNQIELEARLYTRLSQRKKNKSLSDVIDDKIPSGEFGR